MAMPPAMSREWEGRSAEVRLFGPFRLDVRDERLFRGHEELKLRRKPFAILRYMTGNPLRLVTQEELAEAIWGKIAMSESLLRTHVGELRRILGAQVIETVVGRGYRFLLGIEAEEPSVREAKPFVETEASTVDLVGREDEMDILRRAFEATLDRK